MLIKTEVEILRMCLNEKKTRSVKIMEYKVEREFLNKMTGEELIEKVIRSRIKKRTQDR